MEQADALDRASVELGLFRRSCERSTRVRHDRVDPCARVGLNIEIIGLNGHARLMCGLEDLDRFEHFGIGGEAEFGVVDERAFLRFGLLQPDDLVLRNDRVLPR